MGNKLLWFVLLYIVSGTIVTGQISFQPKKAVSDYKGIIYRQEISGMIQWNTYGFGAVFRKGKIRTHYKTQYTHFELDYYKDPREINQNKNIQLLGAISKSFKYGKENYFYALKVGKGIKRHLTEKAKRKGIIIGYDFEGGGSLGFLKPYYLDIIYNEDNNANLYTIKSERYTKENAVKFLEYNAILGRSNSGYGWDEIKIVPGIHSKFGFLFTSGVFEPTVRSLYLGLTTDIFLRKIPIMVETEEIKNKPYFINFYVCVEFGKRSN